MADALDRIEARLGKAVAASAGEGAPPRLAAAMRHAVFPGGARVRPRLCLAVAGACGDPDPTLSDAAAAAIELIHCASLVHDDMPCFDDAPIRRGLPSVHALYGADLALLAGDALIVLGFETLSIAGAEAPHRLATLLLVLARATGLPGGIVGGQGWECEPRVDLASYQRAKTGALFAAATMAGAAAAGADPAPWRGFGEILGEAYQVADDIGDAASTEALLGKPAQRDRALGRPNAALLFGLSGALDHLERLVANAVAQIPDCRHAAALRRLVLGEMRRVLPSEAILHAA